MPAETQRSKKYSYKNQVEAGFKLAGSAGLTAERLEDAPLWKPPEDDVFEREKTADSQSECFCSVDEVQVILQYRSWRVLLGLAWTAIFGWDLILLCLALYCYIIGTNLRLQKPA